MTKFLNRVFFLIPVFLTLASLNAFPQGAERLLQWTPESGISFNGESEYILVDKSEPFNVKALTVEAWVRFSDISGNQIFVNRGAASEDFTFYFYDGKIRMLVQDRTGYSHANADVPPAGVWFHCVGTFDENGVKKLYYNGILQATGKGAYRSIQSDNPLVIGALLGSSFFIERPFHGQMENIRIWNRALSENEIQQLLQTRHEEENLEELRDQGLIAYWAARSGQDDVVQDLVVMEIMERSSPENLKRWWSRQFQQKDIRASGTAIRHPMMSINISTAAAWERTVPNTAIMRSMLPRRIRPFLSMVERKGSILPMLC